MAALAFQGDARGHDVNVVDGVQDGYHGYGVVVLDGDHFDDGEHDEEVDEKSDDALYSVHLAGEGGNYYFGYYLFQEDRSMDSGIVDGAVIHDDLRLMEAFPIMSLQTFY